jgi:hypothetical protein
MDSRYSAYSFWTWALDGGEWLASRPGRALPPGKGPRVPTGQEAAGKILLPLPGIEPRTPVRSANSQTL